MDDVEEFLAHYGVLGMKWGVRKDRKTSSKKRKSTSTSRPLDQTLGRQKKEKQLKKLVAEDLYPSMVHGKKFVEDVVKQAGGGSLATLALTAVTTAAGMAFTAYKIQSMFTGVSMSPIPLK